MNDLENTTIDASELCNLITNDLSEDLVNDSTPTSDVSLPLVKVPAKRGRKPSPLVALRRQLSIDTASEVLIDGNGEVLTVSQIVRKCEEKGVNHPSLWTDIYHFLNVCDHNFVSSGGTGTRTKWGVKPPVVTVESILELIGV
jgi:hypothetical protein